jgi:GT2 family glycosyltransferase
MSDRVGSPRASVIILNYNGLHLIDGCLDAVLAQDGGFDFEVLLVDNASIDGSVAHVRGKYPKVRIIETGRNLGFAGGNNVGLRESTGSYPVLLNNDTRVRPGWLRALVETAESDPAVGAVTAKLVFAEPPHAIQNAGGLLLTDGSGGDRGSGETDVGQYDKAEEIFGVCGASVLLRREMLDEVGTFDETFFMYYEDTDLSWRMRARGWKVIYQPAAVVEHIHAESSREWSRMFIFHVDRNRLFVVLKNGAPGFVARSFLGFYWRALKNLFATMRGKSAGSGIPADRKMPRPGRARVHVRVAASLLLHLPEMLVKRRRIRRSRRVSDAEIARWFYPREQWDAR